MKFMVFNSGFKLLDLTQKSSKESIEKLVYCLPNMSNFAWSLTQENEKNGNIELFEKELEEIDQGQLKNLIASDDDEDILARGKHFQISLNIEINETTYY